MAKQQKPRQKPEPNDLYEAAMAEYRPLALHAPAMQRALLSELVRIRTLMEFIIND